MNIHNLTIIKTFSFLLLSIGLLQAQEDSKYIYKNETVTITFDDGLKVTSEISEKKHIVKSKNIADYSESIYYNNFIEVVDINIKTHNLTKDKIFRTGKNQVATVDADDENIFHSDSKLKQFVFPGVVDNSDLYLDYKLKYNNPRLLSLFKFQDNLNIDNSQFKIICDSDIELGYKLYGLNTDKIKFSKTIENGKNVFLWEISDVKKFETERLMPAPYTVIPHIVYYIKSYKENNTTRNLLNDTKDLYDWYVSLIKQTNTKDKSVLKVFTEKLVEHAKTDREKAKLVFEWVQKNLHYVAFEFAMGGFIPRDAVDVYDKKFGDCKDMANLLDQMFKIANLKSGITWVGTTDKPYGYSEITSPLIDNHMIAWAIIDGVRYYFDATDKFCPFLLPSQMIQGKESMSGISAAEFLIEKIPVLEAKTNQTIYDFEVKFDNNKVSGKIKNTISGLSKSDLLNVIFATPNSENEIWNQNVAAYNSNINLTILDKNNNSYSEKPAVVNFNFILDDYAKSVGSSFIFKPILLPYFSNNSIDIAERKFDFDLKKATSFLVRYSFEIPQKQAVEFMPKDFKLSNTIFDCEFSYKQEKDKILVVQNINIKKTRLEKNDFELWNESLKQINKQSSQSILLKNEN